MGVHCSLPVMNPEKNRINLHLELDTAGCAQKMRYGDTYCICKETRYVINERTLYIQMWRIQKAPQIAFPRLHNIVTLYQLRVRDACQHRKIDNKQPQRPTVLHTNQLISAPLSVVYMQRSTDRATVKVNVRFTKTWRSPDAKRFADNNSVRCPYLPSPLAARCWPRYSQSPLSEKRSRAVPIHFTWEEKDEDGRAVGGDDGDDIGGGEDGYDRRVFGVGTLQVNCITPYLAVEPPTFPLAVDMYSPPC